MASRKGVAATMFGALAKANINIRCARCLVHESRIPTACNAPMHPASLAVVRVCRSSAVSLCPDGDVACWQAFLGAVPCSPSAMHAHESGT